MDYAFYIASALGALAVFLMMPREGRQPAKLGALIGILALGGLLVFLFRQIPADLDGPHPYYYVFTVIALAAAVRVITHARPVYSALFFVMVVLSVAGLFVVLEAEFMAFAMIIIYAGAILVTYLFVIMLATAPQARGETSVAALYDRVAREPFSAALLGFALVAVLAHVMFTYNPSQLAPSERFAARVPYAAAVERMPGRVEKALRNARPQLEEAGLIEPEVDLDGLAMRLETPMDPDAAERLILFDPDATADQAETWSVPLDAAIAGDRTVEQTLNQLASNIDQVGLALFEEHELGIELAGVILLLSMVGAIVIGRKRVLEEPEAQAGSMATSPPPPPADQPRPPRQDEPKIGPAARGSSNA